MSKQGTPAPPTDAADHAHRPEPSLLDSALRLIIRDVVREEIRSAFAELVPEPNQRREKAAPDSPFLSIRDCAATLGVHEGSITRWIHAGKLKALKAGRHYRISRAALNEFMETAAFDDDEKTLLERAKEIVAGGRRKPPMVA